MRYKKMTDARRAALQKQAARVVEVKGLLVVAGELGIAPATLRRFIGGQPAHESTLRRIEMGISAS